MLQATSACVLASLRDQLAAEVATVEALQAQADAREAAAAKLGRELAAAAKANGMLAEQLAAAQVRALGCIHVRAQPAAACAACARARAVLPSKAA